MGGPPRTSPYELDRDPAAGAAFPPIEDEGPPGLRERLSRRAPLVLLIALVALVGVGYLLLSATRSSSVSEVRYVNDTQARVVIKPCGSAVRCVLAAGASVTAAPPAEGDALHVYDGRTNQLRGCIAYAKGERTVHVSDVGFGATC